jgi:DNA-binding NarL/FixJ family response regulator
MLIHSPSILRAAPTSGQRYLETRSRLAKRLAEGTPFQHIQIIDDMALDANVLAGLLRKVLGYDVTISVSRGCSSVRDQWQARMPDLVFLDDRLGPAGSANIHLPQIRRMGYAGPIVVMSGLMTRERRGEVMRLGAFDGVHKDDLVGAAVIELLLRLIEVQPESGAPA